MFLWRGAEQGKGAIQTLLLLDWDKQVLQQTYKKKSRTFICSNHHSCYLHVFTHLLLGESSNLKQFSWTLIQSSDM